MKFGISEGRQMNELIDIIEYREKYPDLQEAFGDDWDAYIAHYFSYGAFEHRDNGTDFDPVDYLNRYSDLQAVFGTDIMAAYKHYKEFGQQEGREGRSEATVKAEKEAAARAQEVVAKEKETTSKVEENTGNSGPAEPDKGSFAIQSVEVIGDGHIRVTLNQKTEQPLALEAFSIICNSGGSDMTILSGSTKDNMVYDLSTTYYRDQEYDIQITLPDGTCISKVFTYRTDCAQIEAISAARTSAGEALVTYISDQPGYFYYILKKAGRVRHARFPWTQMK